MIEIQQIYERRRQKLLRRRNILIGQNLFEEFRKCEIFVCWQDHPGSGSTPRLHQPSLPSTLQQVSLSNIKSCSSVDNIVMTRTNCGIEIIKSKLIMSVGGTELLHVYSWLVISPVSTVPDLMMSLSDATLSSIWLMLLPGYQSIRPWSVW